MKGFLAESWMSLRAQNHTLQQLAESISQIEQRLGISSIPAAVGGACESLSGFGGLRGFRGFRGRGRGHLATCWPKVDQALGGGLHRRAVHEWFSLEEKRCQTPFFPPLAIFIHLAWRAIEEDDSSSKVILWIGRSCWPHMRPLVRPHSSATHEPDGVNDGGLSRALLDR